MATLMAAQGNGRIIDISGLAARSSGNITGSIRNVSVAALTKNLAAELTPQGITCGCLHPGLTGPEKSAFRHRTPGLCGGFKCTSHRRKMASSDLIGRLITAEEIAFLVAFLAALESVAITGDVIAAGGRSRGTIYY
jgi:NAD(P)-dependent dehydrogenase (short-subunit alcohol dehydrogenase family)